MFNKKSVQLRLDLLITSKISRSVHFSFLSMHDYSRDIMLATAQEHIETRMLLAAAENKSKEMEESLKKLEEITRKTDEILYQMIPIQKKSKN